jgi:hypothetical protein
LCFILVLYAKQISTKKVLQLRFHMSKHIS